MNDVLTLLVGSTFTVTITPAKTFFPLSELEDIIGTMVNIFPGPDSWERVSRADWHRDITINLGVKAQVSEADLETELANLATLCEELKDAVKGQRFDGMPVQLIEQDEPYDQDLLHTEGVFSAIITLTMKAV